MTFFMLCKMGHSCKRRKRRSASDDSNSSDEGGNKDSAAGSGKGRFAPPSSRFPKVSSLEQMRTNLRISVGICEICALESNIILLYCHECNVYQRDRDGYVYDGNPDFAKRTFFECSLDERLVLYTSSIHAAVLVGVYARFQNYIVTSVAQS